MVAAERISRVLKKRGVCLCEANAPPELLSQAFSSFKAIGWCVPQAFDEAEVLWKDLFCRFTRWRAFQAWK